MPRENRPSPDARYVGGFIQRETYEKVIHLRAMWEMEAKRRISLQDFLEIVLDKFCTTNLPQK